MNIFKKSFIYVFVPWVLIIIGRYLMPDTQLENVWNGIIAVVLAPGIALVFPFYQNIHLIDFWPMVLASFLFYYAVTVGVIFVWRNMRRKDTRLKESYKR